MEESSQDIKENPIVTTPVSFQFNTQNIQNQSKPKIEIKFKADLHSLISESSPQENPSTIAKEIVSDFRPGQSVQIEYKTKQFPKEKKRKLPEPQPIKKEPPSLEQVS